ncbi:A-kinase anchor protein 1, mitochondrial [Ahaetulla prasina]|uniref:A-kinase anchor protein 1, mitochondrial n=1 Tax=Ahaetulla prasina TaxID=499056 RepID=UPI002649B3BD|nr:A-kinase anchor protein 1, mitochondrial [Ahaetulla prasina]XP_058020217.1 A-kinase anchor protein 1, mitochondrial [Ahaetulla prasina]XP_058020218.1 A-kinase anchor protein 1, mitochondrial [Ahaetulla prasina]
MALRFRNLLPFTIPGVLALIGWWWFSSRKKERVSNHDRQDLPSLEERQKCSPSKEPSSWKTEQSNSELSPPLQVRQCSDSPFQERPVPLTEDRAQSLETLREDLPVGAVLTLQPDSLQDDSGEVEVMGPQVVLGSPSPKISLLDVQRVDDSQMDEAANEGKPDSSQASNQGLLASSGSEKWEDSSKDVMVQIGSSERSLKEDQCSASTSIDYFPVTCSRNITEEVSDEMPKDPVEKEERSDSNSGERETAVETPTTCVESARSEMVEEGMTSSSKTGSMLKYNGCREVGYKGGLEKERLGATNLDKQVEKIEQVAMQIISNVIRAATEEVLSGSVSDMSETICQIARRVDSPREKVSIGGVGQAESSQGGDSVSQKVATVEVSPLLEENVNRHATYSSCLTHGRLVNRSHNRLRDSSCPTRRSVGSLTPATNHEEEFEDGHIVMEDSGCSACTSEDGASAEDLLKSASSPPPQHLDMLNASTIKDSENKSMSIQEPPSSMSTENRVPYSNGVLKEDFPPLSHEQPWPTEADTDHSGGSDVNSMDSVDSGCALRKNDSCLSAKMGTDCNKTELVIWEIEIPKHLVGRLIGKQGRYVSFLKQVSGAKIYISTLPYTQDFQICHIEGSQQNVDKALTLIGKKFKDLSLTNIYAPPPPPLPLHSLPMTSWLMLPDGVTVEVIVVNQVNAGHLFVQQHTHPTFHVLRSLDQQMYLCYSQPGIPTMPTPVEVGVVCAAPGVEGAWWRAQVIGYFKDASEVEIRYVDYGGYERVKIDTLRQIRSDFVTLPFQGAEVLLDNVVPLPDDDHFSSEADTAVSEMTRGTPLLAQVTNYDSATGLPLIQLWSMIGDELVSINRTLVERGFAQWVESY